MIKALIVGLVIGLLAFVSFGHTTEITFENCMPGTWVGGVKWEWKDGIRGNYVGSTYKDIPELELKSVGSLVVDLEPGDYAITHYSPPIASIRADGTAFIIPAAMLDFREIKVSTFNATHSFGCEE